MPCQSEAGIVGIDFVIERQLVVVIRLSGEILTYDPSTGVSEVAALLAEGIGAAAWSPQQDVLLVATGQQLALLDQSLVVVQQTLLNPLERGSAQAVDVGWGSKATQFRGSEGKAAVAAAAATGEQQVRHPR